MGVYIKGMEMPKNCLECEIRAYDANAGEEYCPFSQIVCLSIGRQDNCPLVDVEVPESHGRLIDEDEITAYSYLERNDEEVESLDEFPTVIEAEGSNDTRKAKGD